MKKMLISFWLMLFFITSTDASTSNTKKLYYAIDTGKKNSVQELIQKDPTIINQQAGIKKNTPLMEAIHALIIGIKQEKIASQQLPKTDVMANFIKGFVLCWVLLITSKTITSQEVSTFLNNRQITIRISDDSLMFLPLEIIDSCFWKIINPVFSIPGVIYFVPTLYTLTKSIITKLKLQQNINTQTAVIETIIACPDIDLTIQNTDHKTAADIIYDYRTKLANTKHLSYLHELELKLTP